MECFRNLFVGVFHINIQVTSCGFEWVITILPYNTMKNRFNIPAVILCIIAIAAILILCGGGDFVSSIQKRNKAMTDFGNEMVKSLELAIEKDGLPLHTVKLEHVDDKEIIVRFQRRHAVSVPAQP